VRKEDVVAGAHYVAKVSDGMTIVRIVDASVFGGWNAINTKTNRRVRIRSAMRLRRRVTSEGRPLHSDGTPDHTVRFLSTTKRERIACACGWKPEDAPPEWKGDAEDKLVMHLALSGAMPDAQREDSVATLAIAVAKRDAKPNLLTVLRPPDAPPCDGCPNPTCSDVELCLKKSLR
jgi:hypothetical protein